MPAPPPAAATRHPHLAEPKPEGWVRVDWHLHSMWSGDSTTTPDELAAAVAGSGVDVVCLTDHGTIAGALAMAGSLGCRVVVGQEVRTTAGELIGLFLDRRVPAGLTAHQAAAAIRDQGGLVFVPHPFDPVRHCLAEDALAALADEGFVDAVEVLNAKVSLPSANRRAQDLAAARGLVAGAGSDAHEPSAVGAAYVEMPAFDGPAGFLAAARQGRVVGHRYDVARQWRARIVPSTKGT